MSWKNPRILFIILWDIYIYKCCHPRTLQTRQEYSKGNRMVWAFLKEERKLMSWVKIIIDISAKLLTASNAISNIKVHERKIDRLWHSSIENRCYYIWKYITVIRINKYNACDETETTDETKKMIIANNTEWKNY